MRRANGCGVIMALVILYLIALVFIPGSSPVAWCILGFGPFVILWLVFGATFQGLGGASDLRPTRRNSFDWNQSPKSRPDDVEEDDGGP